MLCLRRILEQCSVRGWAEHQFSIHWKSVGRGFGKVKAAETVKKNFYYYRLLPCPDPICARLLPSTLLRGHVDAVHRNNPSWICNECGKGFAHEHSLKSHITVHTVREKPAKSHLCLLCGDAFTSSSKPLPHQGSSCVTVLFYLGYLMSNLFPFNSSFQQT